MVVVVGAGATGLGVGWDLALRGIPVTVVDQGDVGHGTSGRFHGLLHSGGRYVVTDPPAARACAEENRIVRRVAAAAVEPAGGFFVQVGGEADSFRRAWLEGCRAAGIPTDVPVARLTPDQLRFVYHGDAGAVVPYRWESGDGQVRERWKPFEGVLDTVLRRYREAYGEADRQVWAQYLTARPCPACQGARLRPESLPPERPRPFDWRRANAFASLRAVRHAPDMLRPIFAWCCTWFAISASQTSFILANQLRFGWSTLQNGLALALMGVIQALVQGVLLRLATRRLGVHRTALVGYGASVAGFLLYAGASRPWLMLLGIVVLSIGALGGPSVQSMVSADTPANRQGELQGTLASLQGLMLVLGPPVMGSLFAFGTRPGHARFAGAPFLLSALICLGALLALLRLRPAAGRAEGALPEGGLSR